MPLHRVSASIFTPLAAVVCASTLTACTVAPGPNDDCGGPGCVDIDRGDDIDELKDAEEPSEPTPAASYFGSENALSARREIYLGCRRYIPGKADGCASDDRPTRTTSEEWVEIPESSTKFLAHEDGAAATITLSFNEVGALNDAGARSPVYARVFVDDELAEPGSIRIAYSALTEANDFTFVIDGLSRGIHTVRAEWRMEDDPWYAPDDIPVAEVTDLTVVTMTDTDENEVAVAAYEPPEGREQHLSLIGQKGSKTPWEPVRDADGGELTVFVNVQDGAILTVNFGAEVLASEWGAMDLRAKIDGNKAKFPVNNLVFAHRFPIPYYGTNHPNDADVYGKASRSYTFVAEGVAPGWHEVTFDFRARIAGSGTYDGGIQVVTIGKRVASAVATVPNGVGTDIAVMSSKTTIGPIPDGADQDMIPGVAKTIDVPPNAQVVVTFTAETRNPWLLETDLMIDGSVVPETTRTFWVGSRDPDAPVSTTHVIKRLPPGEHEFAMAWTKHGDDNIKLRDRALIVRVEPMHTPDLGRGPDMGLGAITGSTPEEEENEPPPEYEPTTRRRPVQAISGTRKVLPIIIDPERPFTQQVGLKDFAEGTWSITIDGVEFAHQAVAGDSVTSVRDALVAAIQSSNLDVDAEAVAPSYAGCKDCLAQMTVTAQSLGEWAFSLVVEDPNGDPDGLLSKRVIANAPIPDEFALQRLFFSNGGADGPGAKHYWRKASNGRLNLHPAAERQLPTGGTINVFGPYKPNIIGAAAVRDYWYTDYECEDNAPTLPWAGGHHRRYWEGLEKANADIDFSQFDTDRDGRVESSELVLVLVTPQQSPSGGVRTLRPYCDTNEYPVVLDGVNLEMKVIEVYAGNDTTGNRHGSTITHELAHQLGLDDAYIKLQAEHEAWTMSLMDENWSSGNVGEPDSTLWNELDGFHKLGLGWVSPRTVTGSQLATLEEVSAGREVLILPREGSAGREYFLLENRQENDAWDGRYDISIGDSGLAVWHVVEPDLPEHWQWADGNTPDLGCFEETPTTCAVLGTGHQCPDDPYDFGDMNQNLIRRGLRLVRPGEKAYGTGYNSVWSPENDDIENVGPFCGPGILMWADGTPSPYRVTGMTEAQGTLTFCVEVDGVPCG